MSQEDYEIIFVGKYKDFKLGVHYSMDKSTETDAAYVLGSISNKIDEPSFRFSGININKIKEFATPDGTGLSAVISFLEKNPQAKIKEVLLDGIRDKLLLPAADSFFFNQLLKAAKVDFTITNELVNSTIVPESEEPEDSIAFIGNFKGWMAIKKLGLDEVEDYEVSAILAGISNTIVNKAFDYSGCKKDDELVGKIATGRKAYGNLLNALRKLETSLTGNKLDDAYLVCKVFEKIGYKAYPSPEKAK
jgi:hypothetical protein